MIYVLGDIHLKDPDIKSVLGWKVNHLDLLNFTKSLNLTKEDTVIQLGDLFDKTSHKGLTNKAAGSWVAYLANTCKKVILLQGNHDTSRYSGSNLNTVNLYPNVYVVEDITIIDDNLFLPHIDGLSVGGKYEEKVNNYLNVMLGIKEVNYIFGHHFFKENTIMNSPYLDLSLFSFKYKSCIQGHVHKMSVISSAPKSYCIGGVSPVNKVDGAHDQYYMTIDKELNIIPVPKEYFSRFRFINYSGKVMTENDTVISDNNIPEKDWIVFKVTCNKEEKFIIESELRSTFIDNIYEIEWDIPDLLTESLVVTPKSDQDLITSFFDENNASKEVNDMVMTYFRRFS